MDEEEMRCGFCMEKLQKAIQPKQLPCSHGYCLSCLLADYKKTCPTCKQTWAGTSAETLKPYLTNIDSSVETDISAPCDCCKSYVKEEARVYCIKCENTFCERHELKHDDLFNLDHDKISISTYVSSLSTYKKKKCTEHSSEVVTIACGVCHRMFCRKCDMNAECEGDWQEHDDNPSTKDSKPADAVNATDSTSIVNRQLNTSLLKSFTSPSSAVLSKAPATEITTSLPASTILFGAASTSEGESSHQPATAIASANVVTIASNTVFGGIGQTALTTNSTSLFGSSTTSAGFGGFRFATAFQQSPFEQSTTSSVSVLFGTAATTTSSNSLFGSPTSSSGFGTFAATTSTKSAFCGSLGGFNTHSNSSADDVQIYKSGTMNVKFSAVDGADIFHRHGIRTQNNTRHYCITAMKQYEQFSMEELRLADYLYHWKAPTSSKQRSPRSGFGSPGPMCFPNMNTKPRSPPPARNLHEFMLIQKLIIRVEDDLQSKLAAVSDRRTNVLKAKKQAWRMVEGVGKHSERLQNLVDRKIEQKCEALHQLGCKVKEEIQEDAEKALTEAAAYSNEMDTQSRELLKIEKQLSSQLGRQSDSSGLLDFLHKNSSVLNTVPATPVDEFTFEKKTVQFSGFSQSLHLKSYIPTHLDMVSAHLSAAAVIALSFLPNGDIAIAKVENLLEIRDLQMNLICSQNVEGQLMGVTAFQKGLAALVTVGDQMRINHYTNGLNKCTLIAEWTNADLELRGLTGCGNKLVVSQSSSKTIKLISVGDEITIHETELNMFPDSVCMVNENCLKVSCLKEIWQIELRQNLMQSQDLLVLRWESLTEDGLGSTHWTPPLLGCGQNSRTAVLDAKKRLPKGILSKTPDSSSFSYGCYGKTICALSNDGKYSCMTHPELTKTEEITAIAVNGEQLVVGCGGEGLKIFNIV